MGRTSTPIKQPRCTMPYYCLSGRRTGQGENRLLSVTGQTWQHPAATGKPRFLAFGNTWHMGHLGRSRQWQPGLRAETPDAVFIQVKPME
jgi:hypothetical protein